MPSVRALATRRTGSGWRLAGVPSLPSLPSVPSVPSVPFVPAAPVKPRGPTGPCFAMVSLRWRLLHLPFEASLSEPPFFAAHRTTLLDPPVAATAPPVTTRIATRARNADRLLTWRGYARRLGYVKRTRPRNLGLLLWTKSSGAARAAPASAACGAAAAPARADRSPPSRPAGRTRCRRLSAGPR